MLEITNAAWYAGNTVIKYPIDSEASGYSDSLEALPTDLITDIRLITTEERPQTFYISGVSSTPYLVSIVISDSDGMAAALTMAKPIKSLTHYPLTSFRDTLQGVIALGGTEELGQWSFSSPSQSGLAPTCVIYLKAWPVTSITANSARLQGDILLTAGSGLKLTTETVYLGEKRVDGIDRENIAEELPAVTALVLSLDTTGDASEDPTEAYRGECDQRPDNGDCGCITSLGGATPDQYGNINIVIESEVSILSSSITATGNYSKPSCAGTPCAGVFVAVAEEEVTRPPMQFDCATDPCDDEDNSAGDAGGDDSGNGTADSYCPALNCLYSGTLVPSDSVLLFGEITASGIVMSDGQLCADPETAPVIVYAANDTRSNGSMCPRKQTTAIFTAGGRCGILYSYGTQLRLFLWTGTQLELWSLSSNTTEETLMQVYVPEELPEEKVVMSVSVTQTQAVCSLAGTVSITEAISYWDPEWFVLVHHIYLNQCCCTQWRIQ